MKRQNERKTEGLEKREVLRARSVLQNRPVLESIHLSAVGDRAQRERLWQAKDVGGEEGGEIGGNLGCRFGKHRFRF